MRSLPEDAREIALRLGMQTGKTMDLKQVQAAYEQLCDWVIQAAQERWPDGDLSWWNDVRSEVAWEVAQERWPGIRDVAEALRNAERHLIRGMGPLA